MKPVMNKKCIKIIIFPTIPIFMSFHIPTKYITIFLITAETTLNR